MLLARRRPIALLASLLLGLGAAAVPGAASARDGDSVLGACGDSTTQLRGPDREGNRAPVTTPGTGALKVGGSTYGIDPLKFVTDADDDPLALLTVSNPEGGIACVTPQNRIYVFVPARPEDRTETLTYQVSDGDYVRRGTIDVAVGATKPIALTVEQPLVKRGGKVVRPARIVVRNPNPIRVELGYGRAGKGGFSRFNSVPAGSSLTFTTRLPVIKYGFLIDNLAILAVVNEGTARTTTGKVTSEYIGGWFTS